ncbi:piggyBac transposable element-derived protein 3-like [Belonocnema kinseyi]|uniref:piggyBac transposable element-derived protein 3-like n=1 Tax=Belonocnema kinseyi TaxID=2817044 RepID=UPI00143DD662|nr:piggyBac transposable element-derived protein 3-like [Belonocnema kinseyi]
MPKVKLSKSENARKRHRINTVENTEKENHVDAVFIPDPDDSGESDHIEDDLSSIGDEGNKQGDIEMGEEYSKTQTFQSYQKVLENYSTSQKKLKEEHIYNWIDGEMMYSDTLANDILLSEVQKKKVLASSPTDLFESIIISTMFNKRLSQRDYWSSKTLLRSDVVTSSMGRREFETIKSSIKFYKPDDEDAKDKAWRVRQILNIFNDNIKTFGYFCTALSIDEIMIKFYGKISFKQFIRGKPIRFGIKMWALCGSNGYLFHFDIYCGKNKKVDFLPRIAQGSQVVLQMLQEFLFKTSPRNRLQCHI